MLVFAISDKGGTGRSVTGCNLAYRSALNGHSVGYVDFDFGSPTAGAVFSIEDMTRGIDEGGVHSYLQRGFPEPLQVNVWDKSERESIRRRPDRSGDLVLMPGNIGGSEFSCTPEIIARCADLFVRLEERFDISFVDLSAGRSYAAEMVLKVLSMKDMDGVVARWLIFHRWTRQHIIAAHNLLEGERGLLDLGVRQQIPERELRDSMRFVRTAVVDPSSPELKGLKAAQIAWLRECDSGLNRLASEHRIGRTTTLGIVPHDPVLQWREQVITESDTHTREISNTATVRAFEEIAGRIVDEQAWTPL